MRFDPDAGETIEECIDLEGNPALDQDWPAYKLKYVDEQGNEQQMELPMTFADFAATEGRFRKQFRTAPPDTWNEDMVPLHEFLDLDEEDREGRYPYIWGVNRKNQLMRILCSEEMVRSCEERRSFWRQLKGIAGELDKVDVEALVTRTKQEMAARLSSTLLSLAASGDVANLGDQLSAAPVPGNGAGSHPGGGNGAAAPDYEPVWIETPECTACDECTEIAPGIFAYNEEGKAEVINPKGGSYKDIVRAAEKCTAGCLHPGTPWNPNEKEIDKLIQRAEKYQ